MSSTSLDDAELFIRSISGFVGFPGGSGSKESACNAGDRGSIPGWGKAPGRGHRQPTLVFLPGESHGQRSLVGYSPMELQRVGHD